MKIQRFESIIAWQRVKDLEVSIYTEFSGSKDFGFKDQIQRSNSKIGRNFLLSTFDF